MGQSSENMPFDAARFLDAVREQVRLYEARLCEAGGGFQKTYKKVYPPPFEPDYRLTSDRLTLSEPGVGLTKTLKKAYPPSFEPGYRFTSDELTNQFQAEHFAICDLVREFRHTAHFEECFSLK